MALMARSVLFTIVALWLQCSGEEDEGESKIEGPVIGIDLGTTYSCVAIMKESGVEIIPNDQGNRITPSYVSFSKQGRLIGEAAKNEAAFQPTQTMFDVKRLIGRRFQDATVQEDKALLPYKILEEEDKLKVQVEIAGTPKSLVPEEVSAMVLGKLKETAEAFLGKDVKQAVITVPAYFNNAQREATKDAGKIAGLDVLRIINEPTAAALAYGLDKKEESNILVYDLGGGTFDVSLLTVAEGVIEVMATNGDTHLGGEDFDQRLMVHLTEQFQAKYPEKNIASDKKAMHKLRQAAEKAKITLSTKKEADIEIEGLVDGIDFSDKLTRAKFEELNIDLFKKTLDPIKRVLEDGKMTKQDVDEIVFVGGSTRIPKIKDLVKNFFNGKKPNEHLNPDEAVAYGAAVQGGILAGTASQDVVLLDVTPISLGIETNGGIFEKLVPRNTQVPVKKSRMFETSVPDTTETHIKVFEGERPLVKDNNKLGEFILSGFKKGPRGIKHEVTFDVDVNGIMTVSAKILDSGKEEKMTITRDGDSRHFTNDQIEQMVADAEAYAEEDEKALGVAKAIAAMDKYVKEQKYKLGKVRSKLSDDDAKTVDAKIREGEKWVRDKSVEKETLEERTNELKSEIGAILDSVSIPADDEDEDDDDIEVDQEDINIKDEDFDVKEEDLEEDL